MSYKIIKALNNNFSKSNIFGYDPLVSDEDFKSFKVKKCNTIQDTFKKRFSNFCKQSLIF